MENKDRLMQIFKLRAEGKTYQEIGRIMNLPKQRVYQILSRALRFDSMKQRTRWIYPNIKRYIYEKELSLEEFSKMVGFSYVSVNNYLLGKRKLSLEFVKNVIKLTGLSFEEVIAQNEG